MKVFSLFRRVFGVEIGSSTPQVDCPKCGTHFIGWALRKARHQTCPKCGERLKITEFGHKVSNDCSSFTADKCLLHPPSSIPYPKGNEKDGSVKDE